MYVFTPQLHRMVTENEDPILLESKLRDFLQEHPEDSPGGRLGELDSRELRTF